MRLFPHVNETTAKWLHRIGYVCTAIVALQILAVTVLFGWSEVENARIEHRLREQSRTHDVPLAALSDVWEAKVTHKYLSTLPSLKDMHGNGFRFASVPMLAVEGHYGVAISRGDGDRAKGYLWVRRANGRIIEHNFLVPTAVYDKFIQQIDALTIGYEGSVDDSCFDGTPVAFERVDGSVIRSGAGNCSPHYQKLAGMVRSLLESDPDMKDILRENW